MKKLLVLFVLATTLFSCSSDDNTPTNLVLQKVVFYNNSPNERQWNISNGLLTNITLADGTVVEEFIYDNFNRVVQDIKYSNGLVTETHAITYDDQDIIQSIDALPYTYNPSTKTYAYSYGSNFTILCKVNDDRLAVDFIRTGFMPSEYHMTYAEGDMTSYKKVMNGSTDMVKNFHFDAAFGSNPIYHAVLAVARVKTLTDPGFFVDCQASKNMANGFDGGSGVPYYFNYGIVPDARLMQVGIEVLDANNNAVDFYSFADYHYE